MNHSETPLEHVHSLYGTIAKLIKSHMEPASIKYLIFGNYINVLVRFQTWNFVNLESIFKQKGWCDDLVKMKALAKMDPKPDIWFKVWPFLSLDKK